MRCLPRPVQYSSLISLLGVVMITFPTSFSSAVSHAETTTPFNSTMPDFPFPSLTSTQRLFAVGVAMLSVLGLAGLLPLYAGSDLAPIPSCQ